VLQVRADQAGIRNLGNTCFMICIVQLLWASISFHEVLLTHELHHDTQSTLFFIDNTGLRTAGVLSVVCVVWELWQCTAKCSWVSFCGTLAFTIRGCLVVGYSASHAAGIGALGSILVQDTGWVTMHVYWRWVLYVIMWSIIVLFHQLHVCHSVCTD